MIVSIIIRAYNAEKTLKRALESALAQDFPKELYEVIIINDGSTDNTLAFAHAYANDSRVRIIDQKNEGAIRSANIGFSKARGTYVTLLDADDEYLPSLLSTLVPVLEADTAAQLVYADYYEEFDGNVQEVHVTDLFKTIAGGVLYRRDAFEQEGWYREDLFFPEYAILLQTLRRWRSIHIAQPLFIYHRSHASLTGNLERVEQGIQQLLTLYPEHAQEIALIRSYKL